MPTANASECAGEQGIDAYAGKVGANVGKWKSCYSANKFKAKIQKDQATAVALGARGTPAFFINGRFLSGAQPFPAFQTLIDEELKKAKASGVSKADYYQKVVVGKGAKKM